MKDQEIDRGGVITKAATGAALGDLAEVLAVVSDSTGAVGRDIKDLPARLTGVEAERDVHRVASLRIDTRRDIHFSATSIEMVRGILATCHAFLREPLSPRDQLHRGRVHHRRNEDQVVVADAVSPFALGQHVAAVSVVDAHHVFRPLDVIQPIMLSFEP